MVNSFGGFSGNSNIENFLSSIETLFVNMVVSNSIILREYQKKPKEVLAVASTQVYPRIGLRLAAAKNLDNSPLFATNPVTQSNLASNGHSSARLNLFENVLRLMTDESSPLSQGITNVAASLTAAILIKSIPINSDIKNIDLGENIEKRAFEDLDRIVEIYSIDKSSLTDNVQRTDIQEHSIYIALDIDKATLPERWFNVGNINEQLSIEESQPNANVQVLDYLSIPSNKLAFGWYYLSSTEFNTTTTNITNTVESSLYPPLEGVFLIKDQSTSEDILNLLSEYINDAGLERDTNIIASPNSGDLTLEQITISKKRLYPNSVDKTYDKKKVIFDLHQAVHSLTFKPRRVSPIVSKELVIIQFYTLDKVDFTKVKVKENNLLINEITYKEEWDANLTYEPGDLIDIGSYLYLCLQECSEEYPLNNEEYWFPILVEPDEIIPYRKTAQSYIEGLIYGLDKRYPLLDKKGPKSLLLSVENGNLNLINSRDKQSTDFFVDTFYFKLADKIESISGLLRLRVASTKLRDVPDIFQFLNPIDQTLHITFDKASPEEVALQILKAVHLISEYTDVLSGLVYPHALQFTAFKRTKEEVREVIDILEVPLGLEIATGSSEIEKTPYRVKPRSLIISAIPIPNSLREQQIEDEKMNDVNDIAVSKFKSNTLFQSVKDRLNFLDTKRRYVN